MSEDIAKALLPVLVALFMIWLIYRIKYKVHLMIKNEIFKNFPTIRDTIGNLEFRLKFIANQLESIEKRIKELEPKIKK